VSPTRSTTRTPSPTATPTLTPGYTLPPSTSRAPHGDNLTDAQIAGIVLGSVGAALLAAAILVAVVYWWRPLTPPPPAAGGVQYVRADRWQL
jgi:hypothetical protein